MERWIEREIGGVRPEGTRCLGQAKTGKRDRGHRPLTRWQGVGEEEEEECPLNGGNPSLINHY